MDKDYIDLERSFFHLTEEHAAAEDFETRMLMGLAQDIHWNDILKQPRCVIIAEAGAGKTEEIRHQTKRLRNEGKRAFFMRLEFLKDDFDDGFEGGELGSLEEFENWKNTDEKAWFFLDSVDEAKLKSPRDFDRALRKFDRALGSKREDANVIVTSRLTWEPVTDFNLVKQRLPYQVTRSSDATDNFNDEDDSIESLIENQEHEPFGEEKNQPDQKAKLPVYSLAPLDNDKIQHFSRVRGIKDIDAFMSALERSDAMSFATRPKDLDDLIEYWNTNHEIGTALQLAEHSVRIKIKEPVTDRAILKPLNDERALQGVRRIAAATSLTEWSRIAVPDEEEMKDAISVSRILPEWKLEDTKTLLERALFDEAVYGMVRFHHRSVREYLASQWFLECLKSGSRRNVTQLFFREQYGIQLITPSLRPILPWIAIHDDQFREKALVIAPEVLLQGGDSSQFPLGTRQRILLETCIKLAKNDGDHESFDIAVIQRFARDDMEETVRKLLEQYSNYSEIKNLLLRMVWQGCYTSCADQALRLSSSEKESEYTRICAIRALHAAGSIDQKNHLIDYFVSETASVDQRFASEIFNYITPDVPDIQRLGLILEKLHSEGDRFDRHGICRFLTELVNDLSIADLEYFASRITDLLQREPHIERRECDISNKYEWLAKIAVRACERLTKEKSSLMFSEKFLKLLSSLARYRDYQGYDSDEPHEELPALVAEWPELNGKLFWYNANVRRNASKETIDDYWHLRPWRSFWSVDHMSMDEAFHWIKTKELLDDKLIALTIAFKKYVDGNRNRNTRQKLKRLVSKTSELSEKLGKLLKPPAMGDESKKNIRREASYKQTQKQRASKQAKIRREWKDYIEKHLDQIKDTSAVPEGKFYGTQSYLFERMRKFNEQDSKWSQSNWRILISDQNQKVAVAFREFLIDCAKIYTPPLRSEEIKNSNKTSYGVIFGLSGLEIEAAETSNWLHQLSIGDAQHIVRYALQELNGVPSWLQEFHSAFPEVVEKHFIQELTWELTKYQGESSINYALSTLKYHCDWLRPKMARPLFELLHSEDASDTEHLIDTLQIVFSDEGISGTEITALASKCALEQLDEKIAAIWFAAWVSVDPDDAIEELTKRLQRMNDKETAKQFAMIFVVALVGSERRDRSIGSRDAYNSPRYLCELYLLIHEYVRIDEDNDRANSGVYSPELRDDAQDARNAIFNLLTQIPGKETFLALQRIVDEHPHEPARAWMGRHVTGRAESDADVADWSVEDIVSFEQSSEMAPNTARQLFELGVNRLNDLKFWLEDGEDSAAATWQLETQETNLRIAIAAWLSDRSQNRYSVHQEEEQADKKRPDIRFHTTSVEASVPVELKIVDNGWSGSDLFERLKNQLCNDYLRDFKTRYGVFLLVYRGEKKSWQHPTTKKQLNFDALVSCLTEHAKSYIAARGDIDDVCIVGVDLTKRAIPKRI